MTFDPEKLLNAVELKLRGRTAMLVVGLAVLLIAFWLMLRSYSDHPNFSIIGCSGMLVLIAVFLAMGLFGKARPEEVPPKSLTHVTQLGVVVAHGIDTQKDMVRLMKELSGMQKIPAPTHSVAGSAANPANYVPLTDEQSRAVVEHIERDVERLLGDVLSRSGGDANSRQLQARSAEEPAPQAAVKGKNLPG